MRQDKTQGKTQDKTRQDKTRQEIRKGLILMLACCREILKENNG